MLVRRILVYTRAATARELKLKPSARAKYSPRCTECIDTGLWVILVQNRRLFRDFPTLEHLTGKKEEVRIGGKDLTLDQYFVVGLCGLARYIETKRRHFAETLQELNQTCPTEGGYKKPLLRKIDHLSQDLQNINFRDLLT